MNNTFLKNFKISKYIPKVGNPASSPGTINYIGAKRTAKVKLNIFHYNKDELTENEINSVQEVTIEGNDSHISWLNVTGVHDENIVHQVGEHFGIHPLALENVANTTQRPKLEDYDDILFLIIKMVYLDPSTNNICVEQVSLAVGNNFVVSLQELEGDVFEGIRERLRKNKGKIRKSKSDYLMYAIVDAVIDQYFAVMESISEKIELLEEKLLVNPDQDVLQEIYTLKKDLVFLRKSVWPMREVVSNLQHSENKIIKKTTGIFLRDVYDHTIQILDTVETFRDVTSSMIDLYLSTVSQKMNEVMKVLTIFSAIFIPLTFIAGIYGMNFEYMPELSWEYSYPLFWSIIIILSILMLIIFKKKKWL